MEALELATHSKGDHTQMIRKLARELRIERSAGRETMKLLVQSRSRVTHLETLHKPVGRVLVIDTPPIQEGIDHGFIQVFSDPAVKLCFATAPVHYHDPQYDEALEWELSGVGEMFRRMPWEIGPHYETGWTRGTGAQWRERAWRKFQEKLASA